MKKIEKAINSEYTKKDRYGNLKCVWYENGKQFEMSVSINKSDRDFYYSKTKSICNEIIKMAPEKNREIIRGIVKKYMEDNFTEDAYFIGLYTDNIKCMMKQLSQYVY